MPGGSAAAWPHVKEILQAISAKAGKDEPCCQWVGATGSGHYVKMVHNGIEYGDMQLICEVCVPAPSLLPLSPYLRGVCALSPSYHPFSPGAAPATVHTHTRV